ncbi:hypothetical protein CGQ36_09665 [Nocardiopsis dassonvillei]|nr:hypothetical protein CGQ36_09665 [Nocardiopsis dassonvillei]
MELKVLGPLGMEFEGRDYLPAAPKQRQILALLLLNVDRYVSIDTCAEELWGPHRPKTSVPTIQTYILQIRKALASLPSVATMKKAHELLSTGRGGYRMVLPEDTLDLSVCNRLLAEGRFAARQGRHADAASALRTALAMRRGPMLNGLRLGPVLDALIDAHDEAFIVAQEQYFEAELALGFHWHVLSDLRAMSLLHPLNEGLQRQYMLALYRAGRQAEALEVFRHLRTTLADQLGLMPSPPLCHLHERILASDPELDPNREAYDAVL